MACNSCGKAKRLRGQNRISSRRQARRRTVMENVAPEVEKWSAAAKQPVIQADAMQAVKK